MGSKYVRLKTREKKEEIWKDGKDEKPDKQETEI